MKFLLLSLFLTACAGVPKNKKLAPKEYTINLKSRSSQQKQKLSCSTSIESKSWKQLLSIANSCISNKNFKKLKIVSQEISKISSQSPWHFYYKSILAEQDKNTALSLWMIEKAIERASVGIFYYQKARLLWIQGERQSAYIALERSLSLDSYNPEARFFLGQIFTLNGDREKAQEEFRKVLSIFPSHTMAQRALEVLQPEKKNILAQQEEN